MSHTVATARKKKAKPVLTAPQPPAHCSGNTEDREHRIAVAAYYRAERRGFLGGDPVVDWLEAEAEVDARLNSELH
ncbi:MAG: DUF2934 domain-containing protein [Betaproteobacteria bacterium]|nr:DUF2934 domain-containing protein [Betaproteobacteria bacterium]MDE2622668.1 DUF2934 domain-containing protein [Betaproteobacteria bacterium]